MNLAHHLAELALSKESVKRDLDAGLLIGALVAVGIGSILAKRRQNQR
jgi:hypothetical protein